MRYCLTLALCFVGAAAAATAPEFPSMGPPPDRGGPDDKGKPTDPGGPDDRRGPAKVQWDISRLTEQDLADGLATVRFKADQDLDEVSIRPTSSLTRYLDVQPAGYLDVVADTWYDVMVELTDEAPEGAVGGTIQIRGDRGVLAKPLNVRIKIETDVEGEDSEDGEEGGDDEDDGLNTVVWDPLLLNAEAFEAGEIVTVNFSVSRDLGKVCVWPTPSLRALIVTPSMFDALPATDDANAPIVHSIDVELSQPLAELTSNVGGTIHLRDCQSGRPRRTFDEPLPVDIVVVDEEADAEAAPSAVVSAGDFSDGAVAPAQIVSIFGEGIGPRDLAAFVLEDGMVGSDLAGTIVLFDGEPAPLLAAQFGQVNAIVPNSASGKNTVQMRVIYRGKVSEPFLLQVRSSAPSVFVLDESGQGAILNSDGSLNGAGNPAPRGSTVSVFGTGGGIVDDALEDGEVLIAAIQLSGDVQVTIDGQPAQVQWAGGPGGVVNGVIQLNLTVPIGGLGPGFHSIVITVDGISGSAAANIWVE